MSTPLGFMAEICDTFTFHSKGLKRDKNNDWVLCIKMKIQTTCTTVCCFSCGHLVFLSRVLGTLQAEAEASSAADKYMVTMRNKSPHKRLWIFSMSLLSLLLLVIPHTPHAQKQLCGTWMSQQHVVSTTTTTTKRETKQVHFQPK